MGRAICQAVLCWTRTRLNEELGDPGRRPAPVPGRVVVVSPIRPGSVSMSTTMGTAGAPVHRGDSSPATFSCYY
ncbi:hypothetical protein APICC_09858 [Apis cerana cerana]|uniref:Uncharacterized protein n=1 Tax=Apis cerana cerana TaxID=94128 RepID=A0A2A3EKI9_APICC|nr:hypothetical protein APICC_09858 [Apis cerana cerana]